MDLLFLAVVKDTVFVFVDFFVFVRWICSICCHCYSGSSHLFLDVSRMLTAERS